MATIPSEACSTTAWKSTSPSVDLLGERVESAVDLAIEVGDRAALNEALVFGERADEFLPALSDNPRIKWA